jgi:hypothetical protein
MKTLMIALVAGALALGSGAARAEDTTKKVGKGAEQTGKTVVHGTTGVGKGASKIYHEAAKGVHKTIAKNSKSDSTKAKHMEKAAVHDQHAREKAAQSKKEINRAGQEADKVTDPKKK